MSVASNDAIANKAQAENDAAQPAGDYSLEGAERRKKLLAEQNAQAQSEIKGHIEDGDVIGAARAKEVRDSTFVNPGAADYGGRYGVEIYTQKAKEGGQRNDEAQRQNQANMYSSLERATTDRGQVAQENPFLVQREADARAQQMQGLGLSRDAALGNAPSEAQFQTRQGMNDLMGQRSAQMGTARGLAGLSGAQMQGSAMGGSAAGNLAATGGLARSKEMGEAIGMYGTQAGDLTGQDLQRLEQNTKNSMFNAQLNDDWKLGNMGLAANQGKLGVSQGQTDLGWMDEQMSPAEKQFEYDQRMAAVEAGKDADAVAAGIARDREARNSKRQFVSGMATGIGGAVGSLGGPAGTALGSMGGAAFGKATEDLW